MSKNTEKKYIYYNGDQYSLTANNHLLLGKELIYKALENTKKNSPEQFLLLNKAKLLLEIAAILGQYEASDFLVQYYYDYVELDNLFQYDNSPRDLWSYINILLNSEKKDIPSEQEREPFVSKENRSNIKPYVNYINKIHDKYNVEDEISESNISQIILDFLNIDDNVHILNLSGDIANYNTNILP